jgi:hypothetical protein
MITVDRATWTGREWVFDVGVHEGVYRMARYPVHLTYLGPLPEGPDRERHQAHLRAIVERVVAIHVRKGALPPRGLVVNWRVLVDDAFPGDELEPVRDGIAEVDTAVGIVSDGEGHGYFHPFYRARPHGAASGHRDTA